VRIWRGGLLFPAFAAVLCSLLSFYESTLYHYLPCVFFWCPMLRVYWARATGTGAPTTRSLLGLTFTRWAEIAAIHLDKNWSRNYF